MFGEFLKRLTQPDAPALGSEDARLALTALLIRVAKTDGVFAESEIAQIDRIIVARYGLSPSEVKDLRDRAEELESQAPDTVRFTRAIKDATPYEDRSAVVRALWQVALADGDRDQNENSLLRLAAKLLGVNDRDSNIIRKEVENAAV